MMHEARLVRPVATRAQRAAALAALTTLAVLTALVAGCAGTPTASRTEAPAALPASAAADIVLTALTLVDTPYQRGGNDAEQGFDCSGFTRHVFERSLGLTLPRTAWEQARYPGLAEVSRNDLQPGDLVFFNTLQRAHSHVGIYVGDGRFIHAPRPGVTVRLEEMQGALGSYWVQRLDGARRASATPRGREPQRP